MRRITGLALAAMLMVSMLAGCGENGTVDQNNTTGMIEQGANDMKNDMTKEAQRAKDSAEMESTRWMKQCRTRKA